MRYAMLALVLCGCSTQKAIMGKSKNNEHAMILKLLKETANDPSSIEIVKEIDREQFESKTGTQVTMIHLSIRGKNGFGALVIRPSWFFIENGKIIGVGDDRDNGDNWMVIRSTIAKQDSTNRDNFINNT